MTDPMTPQEQAAGVIAPEWRHCKACNSQRRAETCWKCGGPTKVVADGWEYPDEPDIERLRELAKEVGYAVGFHGSRERDLDLIAAPWAEGAVGPYELAKHIADGLGGDVVDYKNQDKPNGRWSCNIHTPTWTKLIDLSVCPIAAPAPQAAGVIWPSQPEPVVTLQGPRGPVGVDASIVPLVQALWAAGIDTLASCSGHGFRPGNIALRDGRELVIAGNFEEARTVDRLFPLDIQGEALSDANILAPAVGREQIARIIEPEVMDCDPDGQPRIVRERVKARRKVALTKADAILALLSRTGEGK